VRRCRSGRRGGGQDGGRWVDEVGVVRGQVSPQCGVEDAIPVVVGLPDAALGQAAERGLVVLAGCIVFEDRGAFHCRACSYEWGAVGAPTTDEQQLADLLGAPYDDVVRAIGSGWRQVGDDLAGVTWFVSGEPPQVAVGVAAGMLTLAPVSAIDDMSAAWEVGRSFTRDDLLCSPEWIAEATDEIARARRRTFRWCGRCRRPFAPEDFAGYRGVCNGCAHRHHGVGR